MLTTLGGGEDGTDDRDETPQEGEASEAFQVGEAVKIIDGPFRDFDGIVERVDEASGRMRVRVDFFERETLVELDFSQVK